MRGGEILADKYLGGEHKIIVNLYLWGVISTYINPVVCLQGYIQMRFKNCLRASSMCEFSCLRIIRSLGVLVAQLMQRSCCIFLLLRGRRNFNDVCKINGEKTRQT